MKSQSIILLLFLSFGRILGQNLDSLTELLALDTQYCFLQFHDPNTALKFQEKFANTTNDRVVICHYGASHIQSEIVTRKVSQLLKKDFGDAGPGFLFPFSAADTYDGINYKTSHTGKWEFAKSYQLPPKIPLGIRGMTIQTADTNASVKLQFKEKLALAEYEFILFYELHDSLPAIVIHIDSAQHNFTSSELQASGTGALRLSHVGEISAIQIQWKNDPSLNKRQQLRIYGASLEHQTESGLLYHPMGVGASPFQAVLHLEKMKDQAAIIQPDIVIIDYGTNNILYTNEVPENLDEMVKSGIENFRAVNPDVTIILTSTQDLFYKKKYINAAIKYNHQMDSLAAANHCLYWNFYDLSGGYKRIKDWCAKGYAKDDHIHLTQRGYELKGLLLYKSIINTLEYLRKNPESKCWRMPVCDYEDLLNDKSTVNVEDINSSDRSKFYSVKSGDTLSKIASKTHSSVSKLKKLNHLKTDRLQIGQKLRLR